MMLGFDFCVQGMIYTVVCAFLLGNFVAAAVKTVQKKHAKCE